VFRSVDRSTRDRRSRAIRTAAKRHRRGCRRWIDRSTAPIERSEWNKYYALPDARSRPSRLWYLLRDRLCMVEPGKPQQIDGDDRGRLFCGRNDPFVSQRKSISLALNLRDDLFRCRVLRSTRLSFPSVRESGRAQDHDHGIGNNVRVIESGFEYDVAEHAESSGGLRLLWQEGGTTSGG
jgi:hypothetical protein